jgi:hypothetical protein
VGKQKFIESLGARLTNVTWSWDGVRADGSVIFIGWEEDTKRTSDKELECRILKDKHTSNMNNGGRERIRHIQEILENDSVGYLVVATKNANGQIAEFDENLYSVRLETRGSDIYAVSVGLNSAPFLHMSDGDDDSQINQIHSDSDIQDTEKSQLILARRGQGLFRRRLELIESGCRLTGVSDRAHLRASHIKPWRDSTNQERLDGNNGLLLAPHADHLFDRGFISFEDNGKLLVSPQLGMNVLEAWSIPPEAKCGTFSQKQCAYLKQHRAMFGFESQQ